MRLPRPVRIGWESVKANAVPMVVLWLLAVLLAVLYYASPKVVGAFDPLGELSADQAARQTRGKRDGQGQLLPIWQDYVAGTDPTDEKDVFRASITIVDGKVTISCSPELDDARKAMRKYTTWGKKSLMDTKWTEVEEGCEAEFNFFKVSVEMR